MSLSNPYHNFIPSSNSSAKEIIVFRICLIGFLSCITISHSLWFTNNNVYSPIPVLSFLDIKNPLIHFGTSALFIISIIFAGFRNKINHGSLYIFIVCFLFALLLDQLKWQPWCYYFLFIFLAFAVFSAHHQQKKLDSIRIILAFIYIWSGIQKFNYTFFFETYPWLIEPITNLFSDGFKSFCNATFILAPSTEFVAGIGLLFKKTQKISTYLLLIMHVFILAMIGPLGHNSNFVVWPWNITFMLLLSILFLRKHTFTISNIFSRPVSFYQMSLVIVFGFLPILSFFDVWPMYFSSALYSGNTVKSRVYFPETMNQKLPSYITTKIDSVDNSTRLGFFVQYETNVPIYPESEFHINTFKRFCEEHVEFNQELVMVHYQRPNILNGERTEQTIFCDELESFE